MKLCTSCKQLLEEDLATCPEDGAAAQEVDVLPRGARVGIYELQEKLGHGGMGIVYLAKHVVLEKECALKLLHPKHSANPTIAARFLQEARAANALRHENIVRIYDCQRTSYGSVYLVMELLKGETLEDKLARQKKLSLDEFLTIFLPLTNALAAIHDVGVLHRDLKPANIFLQQNGTMTLLDFGIAKIQEEQAANGLSVPGSILGTLQYLSPERYKGNASNKQSDVYALGILFFQTLTGTLPFPGPKYFDFAKQHLKDPMPSLRERQPDLPEALEELIAAMTVKDVEQRTISLPEVSAQLSALSKNNKVSSSSKTTATRTKTYKVIRVLFYLSIFVLFLYSMFLKNFTPLHEEDKTVISAQTNSMESLGFLVQRESITFLEQAQCTHAIPELLQSLTQETDLERKKRAAQALAMFGAKEAIPALQKLYEEAGKQPRLDFAIALLDLQDKTGIALIQQESLQESPRRLDALLALLRADPSNQTMLRALLPKLSKTQQEEAIYALAKIGDTNALEMLKSFSPPKAYALRASQGDPKALAALQEALQDSTQQEEALDLLSARKDPLAHKQLQTLVRQDEMLAILLVRYQDPADAAILEEIYTKEQQKQSPRVEVVQLLTLLKTCLPSNQ